MTIGQHLSLNTDLLIKLWVAVRSTCVKNTIKQATDILAHCTLFFCIYVKTINNSTRPKTINWFKAKLINNFDYIALYNYILVCEQ